MTPTNLGMVCLSAIISVPLKKLASKWALMKYLMMKMRRSSLIKMEWLTTFFRAWQRPGHDPWPPGRSHRVLPPRWSQSQTASSCIGPGWRAWQTPGGLRWVQAAGVRSSQCQDGKSLSVNKNVEKNYWTSWWASGQQCCLETWRFRVQFKFYFTRI